MLRVLIVIASIFAVPVGLVLASSPHDELRGVRQEIRAKQTLLKKTKKVEAAVSQELQGILKNIASKESELQQLDRDLATVEGSISQTEQEVVRVTNETQIKQRQIEQRLGSLYKGGELGAMRMFFSAESFPQMAENIRYMRAVLEHDKRIFAEYNQKLAELRQLKLRLEQDAGRKEHLKDNIASKKREVEQEKQKKASYLSKVQGDRKSYEQSIKVLQANAVRLQSMINRLEAESRRRALRRKVKPGIARRSQPELPPVPDRGFATQKGRLPMPVRGEIVEGFGKHKHPDFNSYTFNKGIFIAAPAGSDIKAIYDGTVIFADYFKGYGNMVIVDHGGGYFSLYAHASRLTRRVGSEVKRGDTLGAVGDVDSTRGPVLYFEIRYQGKPQDPAGWIRR